MQEFLNHINWHNIFSSAATIIIAIVLYQVVKLPFKRAFNRNKDNKDNKSRNTIMAMFGSFIRVAYISLVFLFILQINGIDVSGILAGVGVASIAFGLAIQDTLKDIIRGVSIVSEDYFKMGDYVTIGEHSGTVIYSGIRSTKLKNGLTGDVISIANRNIEKVKVSASTINLDVPLPYELKLKNAESIMEEIATATNDIENVIESEYRGVAGLGDSAINYRLYAKTEQGKRVATKRKIYHTILEILEKHHVSVPYQQLDVHKKA